MTTLREAAQQALETLEAVSAAENIIWVQQRAEIEVEHLRAALAQEEQEPVAWMHKELELIDGMIEVQLRHAAQCDVIANRPMAEKQKGWDMERVALLRKIRNAPPRREWRSLSDEEMKSTCADTWSYDPYVIARAIEAALKEKNRE